MTSSRHKKNRVAFCTCAFSEFSEVSPSGKSSPRRTARVSPASLRLQRHAGRSGLAKLLLSSSTMRSSSQGPVCELAGRAKGDLRCQSDLSRTLLHGRIGPWSTPTVPRPRWSGISPVHEAFSPCQAAARIVDYAKLGPMPRARARLRTLPHGRPKGVLRSQSELSRRLLHGRIWLRSTPTVQQRRWSGISPGHEPFGPCRALSAIRCSAQCPLSVLGCVRRPMAELNGSPEAHWCSRVDFCTGGFGRGRA